MNGLSALLRTDPGSLLPLSALHHGGHNEKVAVCKAGRGSHQTPDLPALDLGLSSLGEIHFCGLSPSVPGNLLQQHEQTDTHTNNDVLSKIVSVSKYKGKHLDPVGVIY